MTDRHANLIQIPGVTARVVVDADYDWRALGKLLAGRWNTEQADLLDQLSRALRAQDLGLMQLQYIADAIRQDEYSIDSIRWLLSELLIRLEEA